MNNTVSYDELINKMFSILDKEEEGSEFTSYTLFEKVSESDDYIKELINSETVDYMKLDSLLMQEAGEHGYFLDKCLRAGKYDGYVFAVKRRKYKRITGIEIKTHCIGFMNFEPDILYNTELNISENGSVQYKELSYGADENGYLNFDDEKLLRQETVSISKENVRNIFNRFKDYLNSDYEDIKAFDAGEYEIIVRYSNGTYLVKEGCLLSEIEFENVRFTDFLNELIDIDDMVVLSWDMTVKTS